MARTIRDVEAYLVALGKPHDLVDVDTYSIRTGADTPPIGMRLAGDVLVLRVYIGEPPTLAGAEQAAFFRCLLEYNATELMHCAYGLEGGRVVLGAALELENLDLNEFEAAVADIDLALARHVPHLRELKAGKAQHAGASTLLRSR